MGSPLHTVFLPLLIPALILFHLFAAPYTKVEESFNMQATHDVLVYGTPTRDVGARLGATYDHFSFPGAVPRTFVGAVLLAGLSEPVVKVLAGFAHAQVVVRAVLGLGNAAALVVFGRAVGRTFGAGVAAWWILLVGSQFHVLFYASRTLPNMFAFGLTTLAAAFSAPRPGAPRWGGRQRVAVSILVFAGVIFRSEVALLLGCYGLYSLVTGQTTLRKLIPPFAISFVIALAISVPIDSYFWQKPVWPELWGFYYNAVLGSSSEWGVSPWHYYATSALPRLFVNPLVVLVLIPFSLLHPAISRPARDWVVPSILFVAIYSIQPHKEARFIFYVIPTLTAAAALSANYIFTRRSKSALYMLASFLLVLSVLASFAASTGMLLLSSLNYPGGEALSQLYTIVDSTSTAADASTVNTVHTDVLSCMTGVTLFGQNRAGLPLAADPRTHRASDGTVVFAFDKTEDAAQLREPQFWSRFDYLLIEDPTVVQGGKWETLGVVQGYAGVEILKPGSAAPDLESGEGARVLGSGALIAALRDRVRGYTGGWWVGPRMEPRIRIMKRLKAVEDQLQEALS